MLSVYFGTFFGT